MKILKLWLWGLFLAFIMSTQALAGAWTANEFVYKPSPGARGAEEKARYDSGVDRVDARLSKEIWVGDPKFGSTLQAAVTAIGSSQVILRVPAGTHNIAADLTIPANTTLKAERGATLTVATGKTLTISGSLEAGDCQVFSWDDTGDIKLNGPNPVVKTAWFGNTAAGINKAITSVSRPAKIELPRGVINLGTTSILINQNGIDLVGAGTAFSGDSVFGTQLIYTGSSYALIIGNAASSTRRICLRDFVLDGNSRTGSKGLRLGYPDPGHTINAKIENVVVKQFASDGVTIYGTEYTRLEQLQSSYNGGAGLKIDATAYIALLNIDTCSFDLNLHEGVLINSTVAANQAANDITIHNCDMQGNGYEGIKANGAAIDNLTISKCWLEGNQADAGRTTGYYSLWIGGPTKRVSLRDNSFRSVTNMWNGVTGNKHIYATCNRLSVDSNCYTSAGFGAEQTVVDMSRANPCVITKVGHGMVTGDRAVFYSFTSSNRGWAPRFEGAEFKVTRVDDNNFSVLMDTRPCTVAYNPATDHGFFTKIVSNPRPGCYVAASVVSLQGEDIERWGTDGNCRFQSVRPWNASYYYSYNTGGQTVEVDLTKRVIPAGLLTKVPETDSSTNQEKDRYISGGALNSLKIIAYGTKTGTGGNKTIKLYWGNTAICTIPAANNTYSWRIEADVTITDLTVTKVYAVALENNAVAVTTRTVVNYDFMANDVPVKITGQTADAGDSITVDYLSIRPVN